MSCLPSKSELFELATQEDVQSRIVYSEDGSHYQAIYDDPDAWSEVTNYHPTLLVSDIEKWFPKAQQLLKSFPFVKSWRLDDLMISFAPQGASVGAHTDHYDVFLIQISGSRQWSYDDEATNNQAMVEDSELSVLANYQAKNTTELHAGDILYLPPNVAHHGVSTSNDCMTCSIGLRAPSDSEMVMALAEYVAQNNSQENRFLDQGDASNRHTFDAADVAQFRRRIEQSIDMDTSEWTLLFGQFISQYRQLDSFDLGHSGEPCVEHNKNSLRKSPFVNFSYIVNDEQALLFVNGEAFNCSRNTAELICQNDSFLNNGDGVIQQLLDAEYVLA